MMTCCSAIACGCSRSPRSSATSPRPAGGWASRARPITPGSRSSNATGSTDCGSESAGGRGCRTRSGPPRAPHHRLALGHPRFGPRRIAAELARPKWGGMRISEHGVWRVLRRFNLNTRSKRLALIARHADPDERRPEQPPKELHIDASQPGEKVQMDCFFVGRLAGAKGVIWQGNTPPPMSSPPTPGPSCAPPTSTPRCASPPSSCTGSRVSSRPPAGCSAR
jgi:hypothetical protein